MVIRANNKLWRLSHAVLDKATAQRLISKLDSESPTVTFFGGTITINGQEIQVFPEHESIQYSYPR